MRGSELTQSGEYWWFNDHWNSWSIVHVDLEEGRIYWPGDDCSGRLVHYADGLFVGPLVPPPSTDIPVPAEWEGPAAREARTKLTHEAMELILSRLPA